MKIKVWADYNWDILEEIEDLEDSGYSCMSDDSMEIDIGDMELDDVDAFLMETRPQG